MADKKIIHVPRRFVRNEWGGTETVIIETSRRLEDCGYQPEIFTSKALCKTEKETVFGIPVRRFSYIYARLGLSKANRLLMDKRGGNVLSFPFFFALMCCKNIKLVHLHTGGRLGAFVRLVSKIRGFPYVISIHGGLLEMPEKQLQELTAPMKGSFNWGKIFDFVLRADRVEEDAAAIICVSRREQELLAEKYPDKEVFYLGNGVNMEYFASGDAGSFRDEYKLGDEKLILCVASFNPQKNQTMLLAGFEKILQKRPDCKLVLIGTVYDQEYYQKVLEKAEKLNNSVIVIPNLPFDSKTLVNAYAACDLFVLPSLYEPFGIVVLEAWAAGKPVACSGEGGLQAFVRHDENGLIFDVNSSDDLAEKVLELLGNENLKLRLAGAGRKTAEEHSWEKITERLIALYEEL
ncbi:MAG: glycosyltransferase family 4 protein [Victivallales bacterium]